MHISIASDDGAADVLTVEIAAELTIRDLKAIIESDSGFALKAAEMSLIHDGNLTDRRSSLLRRLSFSRQITRRRESHS